MSNTSFLQGSITNSSNNSSFVRPGSGKQQQKQPEPYKVPLWLKYVTFLISGVWCILTTQSLKFMNFCRRREMQASKIRAKDDANRPQSAAAPKSHSATCTSGRRPHSAVVVSSKHTDTKPYRAADPATLPSDVQPKAWDLEVCSDCAREETEQRQEPFSIEYTPKPQQAVREQDPVR